MVTNTGKDAKQVIGIEGCFSVCCSSPCAFPAYVAPTSGKHVHAMNIPLNPTFT